MPGWTCPTCGPVGSPFHGDDDELHCPNEGCEQVVTFTQPVLKKTQFTRKYVTPAQKNEKTAAKGLAEGNALLATMRSRKAARTQTTKPKKNTRRKNVAEAQRTRSPAQEAQTKKMREVASSRRGTCGGCQKESFLLAKDPPRCSSCWHEENPEKHGDRRHRGGEDKTVEGSKPKRKKYTRKKRDSPPELDALSREVRAIEACARALEGLPTDSIERVMSWLSLKFRTEFQQIARQRFRPVPLDVPAAGTLPAPIEIRVDSPPSVTEVEVVGS